MGERRSVYMRTTRVIKSNNKQQHFQIAKERRRETLGRGRAHAQPVFALFSSGFPPTLLLYGRYRRNKE